MEPRRRLFVGIPVSLRALRTTRTTRRDTQFTDPLTAGMAAPRSAERDPCS
jgi:hypothetical protein